MSSTSAGVTSEGSTISAGFPSPARPSQGGAGLGRSVRRAWQRLTFAAFPGLCRFCDQPTARALDLCEYCDADLPWLRTACRRCGTPRATPVERCPACPRQAPSLDRTLASFVYAPPIDRLVADIKFHGRLTSAPLLAALLARTIVAAHPPSAAGDMPDEPLPEAIVPVPLSTRRLLRRGHDQAWLLAAGVQQVLCDAGHPIAFAGGALRRVKHTPAQSAQAQAARLRSLVGAFRVPAALPYRHVALLDDVFTTGATLDAAAVALRAAGVARVDAWVVARTPAPNDGDDAAGSRP